MTSSKATDRGPDEPDAVRLVVEILEGVPRRPTSEDPRDWRREHRRLLSESRERLGDCCGGLDPTDLVGRVFYLAEELLTWDDVRHAGVDGPYRVRGPVSCFVKGQPTVGEFLVDLLDPAYWVEYGRVSHALGILKALATKLGAGPDSRGKVFKKDGTLKPSARDFLQALPGSTLGEIARKACRSKEVVRGLSRPLRDLGLVRKTQRGYARTETADRLLREASTT